MGTQLVAMFQIWHVTLKHITVDFNAANIHGIYRSNDDSIVIIRPISFLHNFLYIYRFLTDLEQDSQIPQAVDTYFLKWRYYFQEYVPATPTKKASHLHLHHWVFLIDAIINDYEEDNAHYGSKSIGKIQAKLTGKDIGLEDIPSNYSTITWFVMTPHFHAPNAIREELWNSDTGTIICNASAKYGSFENGATTKHFNEANYIAIPPCLFGNQPGMQFPFTITPDTNLTAIKYINNTFRHLGQMAQWTGLMRYDTDLY